LTRLARGKKILFVEGNDLKILTKLAKTCGHNNLLTTGEITVIPIDGFSKHDRILHTNWAFTTILGEDLKIAALFDRDYKCEDEIQKISKKFENEIEYVHFFSRKEIENYLLIPSAIEQAINDKLRERHHENFELVEKMYFFEMMYSLTNDLKSQVYSQLSANLIKKGDRTDIATILDAFTKKFDASWKDLNYRLKVVPGKEFISALNTHLQKKYQITVTNAQIINHIKKEEFDPELLEVLNSLELFKKGKLRGEKKLDDVVNDPSLSPIIKK
jgi:hypothetical protein